MQLTAKGCILASHKALVFARLVTVLACAWIPDEPPLYTVCYCCVWGKRQMQPQRSISTRSERKTELWLTIYPRQHLYQVFAYNMRLSNEPR